MKKIVCILAMFLSTLLAKDICQDQSMKDMVNTLNKNAPIVVDKYTTMTSFACAANVLLYHYRLNNDDDLDFSKLDKEQKNKLKQNMKDLTANKFCSHPDMKSLLDSVDKVIYEYYLEDGTFFFEIETKSSDCK